MSESRILLIDSDAVRAERTVSLLEFMDFNPRWVTDGADINPGRHRHDEWMAVMVGSAQDAAQAEKFFDWLADAKLPPPVLLMEGIPTAFAQAHGLHEANVWALDTPPASCAAGGPAAPCKPQAAGCRASGRRAAGFGPDRQ